MKKTSILYHFTFKLICLLVFTFVFTGCKDKYMPEESFIKVYDDKDVNRDYFPLGIQPTTDGGYLILSAYNGWNIHLLKTTKEGDFLWEYDLPSQYVNAVPNLIQRNGNIYFVCMDDVGLFTYVMQVDENAKNAHEYKEFQEIKYPTYVFDNESSVFIQNYERASYEMGIFKLNSTMNQIQNTGGVQIFTDVEDKIVNHMSFTGKRFPFFVNITPEKNYIIMSGFNNYSFSTLFLNTNLEFAGVYSGAAFDGSLNALLPLGGSQFALARYSFANLYYNPNATLDPTAIDIAETIPAQGKPELDAQSPVLIKELSIDNLNYVVYLATTKSNQLLLDFYEKGSNELKGSKYLGQSVPLKASDFFKTEDGGLMILAHVTVMGSFNRIATLKLSKETLEKMLE